MLIVSDTTPISNLIQIGHFDILRVLFTEIIIPEIIIRELAKSDEIDVQLVKSANWIKIKNPINQKLIERILAEDGLDQGEAEAIALSIELKANRLLIDELDGRAVAEKKYSLDIMGTLGCLIKAKEKGLIDSVKVEMDKLLAIDYWIHKKLYLRVLKMVNEE